MKRLTATLCLTLAVLLGSVGNSDSAEFAVTINDMGLGETVYINHMGLGKAFCITNPEYIKNLDENLRRILLGR